MSWAPGSRYGFPGVWTYGSMEYGVQPFTRIPEIPEKASGTKNESFTVMKPVKPVPVHNLRIYNMQKTSLSCFFIEKAEIFTCICFSYDIAPKLWYVLPFFIYSWFTFLFFVGKSEIYLEIFPFREYSHRKYFHLCISYYQIIYYRKYFRGPTLGVDHELIFSIRDRDQG